MQAHDLQFTPGPRPSRRTLRAAPQVSELVDLRWEQVDFNHAVLQVRRVKKGTPAMHPIIGDEMRALRRPIRRLTEAFVAAEAGQATHSLYHPKQRDDAMSQERH
jgi:integrase